MYTYAVLSIVTPQEHTMIRHPLLGIHPSEKAANKHFDLLLKDRTDLKLGLVAHWDFRRDGENWTQGRKRETRRAMLSYYESHSNQKLRETIIIERWEL